MNKTILKFELDLSFVLVAITAQLKDYLFCFKINKALSVNFIKIDDHELVFAAPKPVSYFSKYQYKPAELDTEFYIIANKGTDGFLIPEMMKVDYFLLIRNYVDVEDLRLMISSINRIPEIVVAAEVDPKKLKSKENLIF